MAQRILALEFAGDRVRAALAERSWNSLKLVGVYDKVRADDETDLGGALSRLVAETGRPDIVISAMPADRVAKRLLELPFKDARRLHQVVPFALEEHLPFPVDNGAVAFTRLGREADHTLVMAAMVRKTELKNHLDLLQKAGLDPKTVTLAPLALAAMFTRARNGAKPAAHLVVEGDESSTSVVLVDLTGAPRALRSIPGGLMTSDGSVVSPDAAAPILNSVRQTLLAQGGEIDQTEVILAGAAAAYPQVRGLLSDSLAMPVSDGSAFDYTGIFEGSVPNTGRYSSCVAMLLGELPSKPLNLINFRQGEFLFRGRIRGDLSPFYTSGILGAALLGAFIFHFGIGVYANLHRLSQVNAEIAAAAGPVLGHTDPANAKAQLKTGIAKMNHRLTLIGGNLTHSPLDTLVAVSQALPTRFPVEMADVQIDSNGLRVTGQADSFATVDQAKEALEDSGYFGSIEVAHAKAGSDPSKVDFRMDANFKGVTPGVARDNPANGRDE
ncbi:MAG: type II secretion system protein GspL [Candidatus Binatus sp.]|jgi:cell division ATPase FtsA|uniref:type II secretion system protein GspL n=1 Tax=Candidatus Binatus sp. TaxID=2811406 RepID=UPI003D0F284E